MDAAQRCKTCQRAAVRDLRVTQRAPAETVYGKPFACKLCQCPKHRNTQRKIPHARQTAASQQPHGRRGKQGQHCRHQQRERHGKDFRQPRNNRQRGVYPPKLSRIARCCKPIGGKHGALRFQICQIHKPAEQKRHQPKPVIRRKRQRRRQRQRGEQNKINGGNLQKAFGIWFQEHGFRQPERRKRADYIAKKPDTRRV